MISLGPEVAIVDDKQGEIMLIQDTLEDLKVGTRFFKADLTETTFPDKPIDTIKLVFLDLHYSSSFGAKLEPYICIDWLTHIVPPEKEYFLIIWTQDPDRADELITLMNEIKAWNPKFPYPDKIQTKPKANYKTEKDVQKMLTEAGILYDKYEDITEIFYEFYGQIIEVEKDSVLINCLIDEEQKLFEVRRFDLAPFIEFSKLQQDDFVRIKVITKPGIRKFEFFTELRTEALSSLFIKPDSFFDFENLDFLNDI